MARTPIAVVALLMATAAQAGAEPPEARATDVARDLTQSAHAALAGDATGATLRPTIAETFAFDLWESFLLEGRRDAFESEDLAAFRDALPAYMARRYASQFASGSVAAPTLGEARQVRGDWLVPSHFPRADGDALEVTWRLRDVPGQGPRVIDVMLGGSSLLILTREDFREVLDRGGAEALIAHMLGRRP